MSAAPLFRPEVMQAQSSQWLGSIRIGRSLSFSLVTGVALLMAAALVSFAIWGEATRKVSLPGVLVPEGGLIDLSSPQPATVAEVLIKEGDTVEAGQPLIRLRADRLLAGGELGRLQQAAVEQRRTSLQSELRLLDQQYQQRASALQDRQRSLMLDAASLQGELEASQQRVQLGAQTEARFRDLATSGFVSVLQAQQRKEELLDLQQRERNARRNLEATEREVASVRAELDAMRPQLQAQRSQLERQLAQLQQEGQELDSRSGWTLAAPQAGLVSALNVQTGHPSSTPTAVSA
jgi:membrane fusion protein